jgi:hypothetical protein
MELEAEEGIKTPSGEWIRSSDKDNRQELHERRMAPGMDGRLTDTQAELDK